MLICFLVVIKPASNPEVFSIVHLFAQSPYSNFLNMVFSIMNILQRWHSVHLVDKYEDFSTKSLQLSQHCLQTLL